MYKRGVAMRWIFCLCLLLLLPVLAACGGDEADVRVKQFGGEDFMTMSAEDAAVIKAALADAVWLEENTDCLHDCVLLVDGEKLNYHADCGTFNGSRKSFSLSEDERAAVNDVLDNYVPFPVWP